MVTPIFISPSISKDGKTVYLRDNTGTYNLTTNPGGYGTPNANQPTQIGLRMRYWADTDIYAQLVTSNGTILSALLSAGDGYGFKMTDFGLTDATFTSGVHHIKYYPLEYVASIATLTQNSKLVEITGGISPDTWNTGYLGISFWDGATLGTKVFIIDRTLPITTTTFYLTEAWTDATITGRSVLIAPEGDLKVHVWQTANLCVTGRIGRLATGCGCNQEEELKLMRLVMWLFSSQVNFECKDYQGAHNKTVAVDLECNDCVKACVCN